MEPTTTISSVLSTAFQSMSSDIMGYVTTILPIALGIVGAIFGIRWAVKFFKSIANK